MEYRNLFLANPARLSVKDRQLVIRQEETVTVPLEDISALLIESRQVSLSAYAAGELTAHGVTVILCDNAHLPCCQLLPMNQYSRQRKLLTAQFSLPRPLQKRLWRQIVVQKIRNQALCLRYAGQEDPAEVLLSLVREVRSGDRDNREAVAAALYFPALFGADFTRSGEDPRNAALNYGYAILRAAIARNLVVHGLEPCLGLHHRSELNSFNLADDLIEPYRPLVDLFVARALPPEEALSRESRVALFNLTNYLVLQGEKRFRVMSAVGRCAASLARCVTEQREELELPELLPLERYRYE